MLETFGQGKNGWLKFTLPVVPRRSETLELHLFQADELIETVRIRNPLFGRFPNWQPEPLPATKTSGDLKVRLTGFSVGVAELGGNLARVNRAQTHVRTITLHPDPNVVFKLDLSSPRGTNEAWLVSHAELSDATGNRVHGRPSQFRETDEYSFGPALWPEEAAWRLKLTLSRSRGFDPEELVTFTRVRVPSVGATNITFTTNRIQGVPVVLKQVFVRNPDLVPLVIGKMNVTAELVNSPEDFEVNYKALIAATSWPAVKNSDRRTSNSDSVAIPYSISAGIRTTDVSWIVMFSAEFLVKPPLAK